VIDETMVAWRGSGFHKVEANVSHVF
jgi:hypothetical protein